MAEKIVIASGKGGVGKTSVCVGLGRALCALGKKVLIIDCDCLRSVDILTGVTEKLVYDWSDVIFSRCDKIQAVYETKDVSVMTSPTSYEGISTFYMKELLSLYEEDYDYILLDAPAGLGTPLRLASAAADRAIVVSTPDMVCVRSACTAGDELIKLGIYDVRLIINRVLKKDVKKGRLLNMDSVIDNVQVQLIGIVPEDAKLKLGSMGMTVYKKGQVSFKPFTNIAKRICGTYVELKV